MQRPVEHRLREARVIAAPLAQAGGHKRASNETRPKARISQSGASRLDTRDALAPSRALSASACSRMARGAPAVGMRCPCARGSVSAVTCHGRVARVHPARAGAARAAGGRSCRAGEAPASPTAGPTGRPHHHAGQDRGERARRQPPGVPLGVPAGDIRSRDPGRSLCRRYVAPPARATVEA